MEEDIKLLEETIKLKIEQGCKALECGVTKNNTKLRCEIIQLKNKIKEQEKIIKLMAQDIADITGSCPYDLHNYKIEDCENICAEINQYHKEYGCFIDYYEKKVRETYEKR